MATYPLYVSVYKQHQINYAEQLDGIQLPPPIEPENQQYLKIASTRSLYHVVNRIADENRQAFASVKLSYARISQQLQECEKMLRSAATSYNQFRANAGYQLIEYCKYAAALEKRLEECK